MVVCPVFRVTSLFPGPKQAGPGLQRFRILSNIANDPWIELCIGCHLCDLSCPSGVKISDINLSAKNNYLGKKGRLIRDWFLSRISILGNLGTIFSPVVNLLINRPETKIFLDKFLKIEKTRELPKYENKTFRQWFNNHRLKGKLKIAYFHGCYTNTNEIEVGIAAVEVLQKFDFEVVLPKQRCCGLAMLGNGDLKGAKKFALKNVSSLLKIICSGLDIIFTSTSCGYMIKHIYHRLFNIPEAQVISKHIFEIFEYLRILRESGYFNLNFKKLPLKVAYFAPCHLKTLGIGLPSIEIIRLIPDIKVEYINVDCCGMGGTFGFKKEKYEISKEIGNDLKEAIINIKPDVVLTECEGCRIQIRHLTGLKTLHPIQILKSAI